MIIIGFCGLVFVIGKWVLEWFGTNGIISYCYIVAILVGIVIANIKEKDSNSYRYW